MLSAVRRGSPAFAAACLLLFGACGWGSSPAPAPKSAIHIGVDLPLSGGERRAALPALNGIKFFVQQHPTVAGFPVVIVPLDDTSGGRPSGNQGVTNIESFIADQNLVAVIGPFNAGVARKQIPVANAAGLAMISPATSNPCLTKDVFLPMQLSPSRNELTCKDTGLPSATELRPNLVNNFFRLSTTDTLQGPAAADYAFKTLDLLRVAVISDHEVYGQGLAAAFNARYQKLGGTVAGNLDVDIKAQPDVTAFLKSMKAAKARAIYFGGFDRGCLVRAQMKTVFDSGDAVPFLGGDGIAHDPACTKDAGANAAGMFATVPIVNADTRVGAAAGIKAFKAAFSSASDYGPYTMLAYDATAVLYHAIELAIREAGGHPPSRGSVIKQLSATTDFAGSTGTIGFDKAGDTTNRVVTILEPAVSDLRGAWKFVDSVDYSGSLPY
jgi:branched-chain amino acid transport system substrate-binding protein